MTIPDNLCLHPSEQSGRGTGSPPKPLLLLLILAIWLLAHPHQGLRHDAIFYAGQALFHLQPERYGHDLFFLYGSQDDFTLFTPLYAALIDLLGLPAAMILLLVAGYVLWAGGAAFLAGRVVRGFPFWLGLVLIFALPGYYATGILLRYAEPFLTPRLVAEGLTLLSLALLLAERRSSSFALLLAALAMHPLMALAGIGFAGFYLLKDHPRTVPAVAALGAALVLLLAFLQIGPCARLLAAMDKEWFEISFVRSPFIFWDGWKLADWNRVLFAFSLLLAAGSAAQGRVRRAFLSALAAGAAGVTLFWLGTSLFHNVLLIQLQTCRWLWLSQFFASLAAAWLIDGFWSEDRTCRLLLLGFLTAWLLLDYTGGGLAVLSCALFIWHTRSGKKSTLPEAATHLLSLLPLGAAAWWLRAPWREAAALFPEATGASMISLEFALAWGIMFFMAGGGILALPCFLAVWRYGSEQRKIIHLTVTGGILLLLALALLTWDRPNKWNRVYLPRLLQDPIPVFSRLIPEKATVYWEEDLKMTWFVLGRASYASFHQLAGLAFNRQTAMEGKRRMDRLAPLGTRDSVFAWRRPEWGEEALPRSPQTDLKALVHVCHDPALDFVVLSGNFAQGVIAQHLERLTGKYFYLYDCAELRREFAYPREAAKAVQ